jgi:hypothetical protein
MKASHNNNLHVGEPIANMRAVIAAMALKAFDVLVRYVGRSRRIDMKTKSLIAGLAMLIMAEMGLAQQTGSVTLTGTNPAAVSLTNTSDAALSTTVALGTLTPTTGGTLTSQTFQVRMRSSKAYVLSAHTTALSFTGLGATDGGNTIAAGDLTPFVAGTNGTLNDISANTQILSGSRISSKGNISTNNNFILATLGLATLPQYFTPNTDFSATITLTVTAP